MHAIHVTVAADGPAPAGHLDRVIAEISSRPGFVHGYWLQPSDGAAHAYVFFDTEEQARAKAPTVGQTSPDGAQITGVEYAAVARSA
jgi:hypothetical protein